MNPAAFDAGFTMNGGTISGKLSTYGGGVYVASGGEFTKTGGTIYGSKKADGTTDEDASVKNTAKSGGNAVYVWDGKKRNATADENVNLDSRTAANWE